MLSLVYFVIGFGSGSALVTIIYLILNSRRKVSAGLNKDVIKTIAMEVMNETTSQSHSISEFMARVVASNTETVMERKSEEISGILKPMRDLIDDYSRKIRDLEINRKEEYGGLKEVISSLMDLGSKVKDETRFLSEILRNPQERGKWGEMSMRRIVELAGMVEHIDFEEQFVMNTGDRPDMIVNLPGERRIILDAKAPFSKYLEFIEASDQKIKKEFIAQFASDIRSHIRKLSSREYSSKLDNSADFVIMYLPAESMLSAAMMEDHEIMEYSMKNDIIISSPIMLMALMKIVSSVWRERKSMDNAVDILRSAESLNERIIGMFQKMESMGRSIDSTVKTYNEIIGTMKHRVLPVIKNMEQLGGLKGPEKVPEQIENSSRKGELMDWIETGDNDHA